MPSTLFKAVLAAAVVGSLGAAAAPERPSAPARAGSPAPATASASASASASANCPVVDVMAVYTPKAAAAAGGTGRVFASAQQIATRMNRSLKASGVCGRIRIVHPYTATRYQGSEEFSEAYANLRAGTDPALGREARERRERYGADLVTLMVDVSGRGGGTGDYSPRLGPDTDAYAYSVVDVQGIAQDSASHEIGHNLGLAHDRTTLASTPDGAMEVNPEHPYNTGWVTEDRSHYTIMAYRSACGDCRRVSRFSGAEGTWKGMRMGDAANDSARALRQLMPVVAAYRSPR
ncbi:M12 family metallo-peptidase [uncultured Streptomyces sp.]|uniref:M12 family metallo-peptidase n=1 Tax=uncultured Streptomyces sp. TaxID=174707 RepID=UPI0026298FA0|nr:M12 family metallo-peptidase [uncultured Streptomyces sp.]